MGKVFYYLEKCQSPITNFSKSKPLRALYIRVVEKGKWDSRSCSEQISSARCNTLNVFTILQYNYSLLHNKMALTNRPLDSWQWVSLTTCNSSSSFRKVMAPNQMQTSKNVKGAGPMSRKQRCHHLRTWVLSKAAKIFLQLKSNSLDLFFFYPRTCWGTSSAPCAPTKGWCVWLCQPELTLSFYISAANFMPDQTKQQTFFFFAR